MLNWFQEDYVDFAKKTQELVDKLKSPNAPSIFSTIVQLAEQQNIIACYMAEQAGVDEV